MLQFTLFGFPIHVHWVFWLSMAFIGGALSSDMTPEKFQGVIMFILAGFMSILIHELGHAFSMRMFGGRAAIMLHGFGGYAVSDRNFKRWQHIIISLLGPIAQLLLGAAFTFWLMKHYDYHSLRELWNGLPYKEMGIFDHWLIDVIQVSFFWAIFNLIPIFPLDGGHVIYHLFGPRWQGITFLISVLAGVALIYLFVKAGLIIGAIFLGIMTFENIKRLRGQPTSSSIFPR